MVDTGRLWFPTRAIAVEWLMQVRSKPTSWNDAQRLARSMGAKTEEQPQQTD